MIGVRDVKEGLSWISQLGEVGPVQTALGYVGCPVTNLKKTYYPAGNEKVGPFLKRHVFTWGIIGSIVASVVGFFAGKVQTKAGEETPKLIGWIRWGAHILTLGLFAGSVYSSAKGIPTKVFLSPLERMVLEGKKFLDHLLKPLNIKPTKYSDSPLRYPEITSTRIKQNNLLINMDEGKQAFLVGRTRTGKTKFAELIMGMIKDHEDSKPAGTAGKREVVTFEIKGSELLEVVTHKNPASEAYQKLAKKFGEELFAELLQSSTSGVEILQGIAQCLVKKYDEERGQNRRLVVLLDECDRLTDMAKKDGKIQEELMTPIYDAFADIFENRNNDIFLTSNQDLEEMWGVKIEKDANGIPLPPKGSKAEKLIGRIGPIYIPVHMPDEEAKCKVIGVYLRQIYKKNPNLFDGKLGAVIEKANAASDPNDPESFDLILGDEIQKYIDDKLIEVTTLGILEDNPHASQQARWCYEEGKKIFEATPGTTAADQRTRKKVIQHRLNELRKLCLEAYTFRDLPPGHIETLIINLSERSTSGSITIEEAAKAALSWPAESAQVAFVEARIGALKSALENAVVKADEKKVDDEKKLEQDRAYIESYRDTLDDIKNRGEEILAGEYYDYEGKVSGVFDDYEGTLEKRKDIKVDGYDFEQLLAKLAKAKRIAITSKTAEAKAKPVAVK